MYYQRFNAALYSTELLCGTSTIQVCIHFPGVQATVTTFSSSTSTTALWPYDLTPTCLPLLVPITLQWTNSEYSPQMYYQYLHSAHSLRRFDRSSIGIASELNGWTLLPQLRTFRGTIT